MTSRLIAAALFAAALPLAAQQSPADHIAMGDREHTAMNASAALKHYEAAIAADPKNYEALWKGARDAVDLGMYEKNGATREKLYRDAELYGRRAVEAKPADAEGHFQFARALGKYALSLGVRDRIKYAGDIRTQALEALKIDPAHPGALHVMGMWNAEIMRLNGFNRFMAKNFLGGQIFNSANWADAVKYMEQSVAHDPNRIVHHLDLGMIYLDVKQSAKAKTELEAVLRLPATDFNDPHYKAEAQAALNKLR